MDGTDQIALALEFASWFAFGLCVLLAIAALVVRLIIGTWVATQGFVIVDDDSAVVRWFRESGTRTGEATLTPEQLASLGGRTEIDIYYRSKRRLRRRGRVRLEHPHSPARILTFVALGFLVLGIAATVAQLIMFAVSG